MGDPVNIEEYQQRAVATALPTALNYDYLIPGLVAEVGEVFGKVAKSVRDEWSRERLQDELKAELGDCVWFSVLICHVADVEPAPLKRVVEDLTSQEVLTDLLEVTNKLQEISSRREFESHNAWYFWTELYTQYIARVAMVYEIDMQEILEYNIEKLESRKARGTLKGSGDSR